MDCPGDIYPLLGGSDPIPRNFSALFLYDIFTKIRLQQKLARIPTRNPDVPKISIMTKVDPEESARCLYWSKM